MSDDTERMVAEPSMTFQHALNAMERAAQETTPADHGYGDRRRAVLAYVAYLETRAESAEAEAKRLREALAVADWFRGFWNGPVDEMDEPDRTACRNYDAARTALAAREGGEG